MASPVPLCSHLGMDRDQLSVLSGGQSSTFTCDDSSIFWPALLPPVVWEGTQ